MSESSFDKNLKKAEDAIRKNNADYAIQILNTQLLKTQPDHQEANDLYFKAIKAKWKAKGKMPKPAWLKTKALQAYQLAKRWDGLADGARVQYADDPMNGKVLELLAEAQINLNLYHAAYSTLVQLTEGVDAKSAIGWFWKAKCEDQLGKIGEAIDSCARAKGLDNNKEYSDYYKQLSAKQAFEANKDKQGVLEVAGGEEAIKKTVADRGRQGKDYLMEQVEQLGGIDGNTDKNNVREVARTLEKAGEFAQCVKAWKRFYELTNDPQALDEAGDATIKHYNQLIDKARKSERDDSGDKETEFRKKLVAFKIQEYNRRIEQRPTDLALWLEYGTVLYEAGRFSDAAKALQKASKDPKKAGIAALMLGRSFFEIERHDLAIMQFDRALEEHQKEEDRLETMYWKAKSLLGKGQPSEAREMFLQIQMEDFDYQDVQQILDSFPA
ncbi:MAG: tetratricopeptide repeat protein [Planctomycetota bacterium]